jgi:hypothetical protein
VITNERSDYTSTKVGYMNSGRYVGTVMGSGHTVGNLDFVENGQIQMSTYNFTDPRGIKDLIESAVTTSIS